MSDDEIELVASVTVTETISVRAPTRRATIDEHWCMHAACGNWGSFGYQTRYGTEWYCGAHRDDGEAGRR